MAVRRAPLNLGLACLALVGALAAPVWAQPGDPTRTPPTVATHVEAFYPETEIPRQTHADVILYVVVDVDGHVSDVQVHQSAGKVFDEAAIVAVRQWTFVAATKDGKPVRSRITIPFHFAPPAPPPTEHPTVSVDQKNASSTATHGGVPSPSVAPPAPSAGPAVPAPSASAGSDIAPDVEDVNARSRLEARSHGTSDYEYTLGQQQAVPRTNASDVLKLAPGFLLTNEGGSGHAEQVFLRGFDAHEGQDLEFTVDGVPINDAGNLHGNGYADTHFIIPELIHSLRVLEGPYAPQQGNFAVAGSADYQLGLDRRGLTTEYTTGSFGTQRLLLLWGPQDASVGTFGGAEYYTTDGFGTNRQGKRGTAMGQYEIPVGDKGVLRIAMSAYATEFNTAGAVRQDDYLSGRVGFYGTEDPNQSGDEATRVSLSATYERKYKALEVSTQLFVVDRTMRLRENFTGFVEDVQTPTQEPHVQRGDLIDQHFDEVTIGSRGSARYHTEALGLKQELEAGYFARVDQTSSQQYRIAAANGAPYKTDADLTSTLGDVGVYLDGNVHLLPWLALRGGVRADMFLFDVLNNCAVQSVGNPSNVNPELDTSCLSESTNGQYREPFQRSTTASGALMPRATVLMGPFDHFAFTFSIGDGVRSIDPIYVAQGANTPFVKVQSQDFGVSYDANLGESVNLTARSVAFQTHVDQDLVFDPTVGRSTLSTGSTRTGGAVSARALGSFFDIAANGTIVKATFDDTHLLVPYVPDLVLRGDVALFHPLPWLLAHQPIRGTIGYGVSYVGRRPLPYGEVSDVIFVSDASLGLAWSIWNVRLAAQNLFGTQYKLGEYNYVSDFHTTPEPTLVPERMFTAGAPRTVLLSLSATFGGS